VFQVQTQSVGKNATRRLCQPMEEYEQHNKIVFYADCVLTLIVPFIALIILLALMTVAIVRSVQRKQKRTIKKTNENGTKSSLIRKLPQVRVAKMLYILSVSVVFLNAPSHAFKVKSLLTETKLLGDVEGFVHLICLFISYLSFSLKFFICVACSKNFRKLFFIYCCRGKVGFYRSVQQQTMETAA